MRSAGTPRTSWGTGLDSPTAAIVVFAPERRTRVVATGAGPRLLLGAHPEGCGGPRKQLLGGSYCCTRKSTVRVSLPLSITSTLYLPFGQLSWLLRVKWTRSSPSFSV